MAKEFFSILRHQSMVEVLGTRNANTRIVFAHIYGYTQKNGAWEGTQAELAEQIELPYNTVNDQIHKLIEKGLLRKEGNRYWTIPTFGKLSRHSGEESRDSGQNVLPLNNPPIKNQDEGVSDMTTTFEVYKSLFKAAHPDEKVWADYAANAERKWGKMDPEIREMILEQLRAGEETNDNPYFLLKDWKMPQPKWLTGMEHDSYLRAGKIVCICRDDSKPRVPIMRPIELNEARKFKLPCLRFEWVDRETHRLVQRDHTALDFTGLPVARAILSN